MGGEERLAELFRRKTPGNGAVTVTANGGETDAPPESPEASCKAFTFLRGIADRAVMLELRFRTGDSEVHSYNCLQSGRFNRSVGLLLKFSGGDVTTLVIIRGSNLDLPVDPGPVSLPEGLQRHRIVAICEMDEDDLKLAGSKEPTIDRIEVGEFESVEEQKKWLQKVAPAFLREMTRL